MFCKQINIPEIREILKKLHTIVCLQTELLLMLKCLVKQQKQQEERKGHSKLQKTIRLLYFSARKTSKK